MLKVWLLPLLAVLGGAGGFFLRRWELAAAFEDTGLAVAWAPSSLALIALSVVMALALALLCRGAKREIKTYGDAFYAPGGRMCLAVSVLSAACLLVAAASGFLTAMAVPQGILNLLLWVLCAASFFCVLAAAWGNYRAVSRKYSLPLLVPGYMACLWLVTAYQQRAAEPVVLVYLYELLAIICTLLGLYFAAAYSFEKGRLWRSAFFPLMGIYFSLVTLADSHSRAFQLLYLFAILYQLASVTTLLKNAFGPAPKRLASRENNTQEVTPDE